MGISFFETMTGELIDDAGDTHHVAMDLRCDAARIGRFFADGKVRATGTIRVEPWADGSACEGTVTIRPLLGKRLEYDLSFIGKDGQDCRLVGRKDVKLLSPKVYQSLTTLKTRLECDGETIASGVMNFHADDLLAFTKSWSIGATAGAGATAGNWAAAGTAGLVEFTFTEDERRTVFALAEALITPGKVVPPVDPDIALGVAEILPHLPPLATGLYRVGLQALDTAARTRFQRSFADLDHDQRLRVLEIIESLGGKLGTTSLFALGVPIRMVHFGRRDFLDALGLPDYVNTVNEPEPRWVGEIITPDVLDPASRVECDVVVVGTGAGGGAVAATLAEKGLAVVMVEEGPYAGRRQFTGPPERRVLRYWRDGGMNVAIGNAALAVPAGRVVGGTTTINSGTCFRTPDHVLEEWRAEGFPSDFESEKFSHWLDRAETELQVTPGDPRYLGQIARAVAKGAGEMGANHGPLRRNAPACDGHGICVAGCPTGAKLSSAETWIPRAMKAGAMLYSGLPATRILTTGRRAIGVLLEGQDSKGAPRRVEIRSRAVVVAGGSLMTPLLLRRNGVALPMLGRNLSIHPGLGVMAMFERSLGQPWRAIPQGYFVDGIGDDRIRFEGYYSPPPMLAPVIRVRGDELTRWLDAWSHVGQFGFMTRDTGVGSVSLGPNGRPVLRYSLTPRVVESMRKGSAVLAEMLLRGGANEVATLINGVGSVTDIYQARAIADMKLRPRDFSTMGFHPLGTARMGASPDKGVVDFDNCVYGYEGLFVADGSSVPSSLGVNPMITIMAMALRAGDIIAETLG